MKKIAFALVALIIFALLVAPLVYSQTADERQTMDEERKVADVKPTLTDEQIVGLNHLKIIYESNLKCYDSDGGINPDVKGTAEQKIEANIIEAIIFFFKSLFSGIIITPQDMERNLQKGVDECRDIGQEEWEQEGATSEPYNLVKLIQTYGGGEGNLLLREVACENYDNRAVGAGQDVKYKYYVCPNGCSQGACIKAGENKKPERNIDLKLFANVEGMTSEQAGGVQLYLNVPVAAVFARTQQEFDSFTNPSSLAYVERFGVPAYLNAYSEYPIITLKRLYNDGNVTIRIENVVAEDKDGKWVWSLKPYKREEWVRDLNREEWTRNLIGSEKEGDWENYASQIEADYRRSLILRVGDYEITNGLQYYGITNSLGELQQSSNEFFSESFRNWSEHPESVAVPVVVKYLGEMQPVKLRVHEIK